MKERKAEVAREFSGFQGGVISSAALWPLWFDLKGSKATLSSKSVKLQVPCGRKTPVESVGRFSSEQQGVSHRKRREFRRMEAPSETAAFLLQGFCLIAGLAWFPTVYHQMTRRVTNSEAKAGWKRGGQLLGGTPGGDHSLEWHL